MDIYKAINCAKQNDQKAFNFLLNIFWDDVYRFQLKRTQNESDAEDITIQAFARAFDKIETYNSNYSFKTWLITISKNIHIDFIRKEKFTTTQTLQTHLDDSQYPILDDSPTAEDALITEQNLVKLLSDIKKLKPHYQKVITMRYFQEMSYKDISKTLNEPVNNVKVKLLRAKKLLAEIIVSKNSK